VTVTPSQAPPTIRSFDSSSRSHGPLQPGELAAPMVNQSRAAVEARRRLAASLAAKFAAQASSAIFQPFPCDDYRRLGADSVEKKLEK